MSKDNIWGALLDSAEPNKTEEVESPFLDESILDSAAQSMANAVSRTEAMAVALEWAAGDDFSYNALDGIASGIVFHEHDILDSMDAFEDDSEEFNAIEMTASMDEDYMTVLDSVADALIDLGGDPDNVHEFINDECDNAGAKLGENIVSVLDNTVADDGELITRHALGAQVLDKMEKRIIGGKKVLKKKRVKKAKLSSAQRRGLKKAQKKAHSGKANRNRAKSMKLRSKTIG